MTFTGSLDSSALIYVAINLRVVQVGCWLIEYSIATLFWSFPTVEIVMQWFLFTWRICTNSPLGTSHNVFCCRAGSCKPETARCSTFNVMFTASMWTSVSHPVGRTKLRTSLGVSRICGFGLLVVMSPVTAWFVYVCCG